MDRAKQRRRNRSRSIGRRGGQVESVDAEHVIAADTAEVRCCVALAIASVFRVRSGDRVFAEQTGELDVVNITFTRCYSGRHRMGGLDGHRHRLDVVARCAGGVSVVGCERIELISHRHDDMRWLMGFACALGFGKGGLRGRNGGGLMLLLCECGLR